MVNFPSDEELSELKRFRRAHSLTSYIAFRDSRSNPNHNRIEYKNMLRDAEFMLVNKGANSATVDQILNPMRDLLDNDVFWPPKHEDLAIFANPEEFRVYRVPEGSIESELVVQDSFLTTQLEVVMKTNKSYFVLALSRKNTQLFRGDFYSLAPVEVKGLSPDMKTALNIDEYPHSRQIHSINSKAKGKGSEGFHDQAEVKNTDKEMLFEYFRLVDKRIKPVVADVNLPLVIGGVDNLVALYTKANSYAGMVGQSIHGNLDHTSLDTIREKACAIVQAIQAE